MLTISLRACSRGDCSALATAAAAGVPVHRLVMDADVCPPAALPELATGTILTDAQGEDVFRVTGHVVLPAAEGPHALACPLLTACRDVSACTMELAPVKRGISLAWVTLSDSGHAGRREDASGPALAARVQERLPLDYVQGFLLPDSEPALRALLTHLALTEGYDLILTTGGTGLAPTDVSPEATARVLDYELPGFVQAMMQASLACTPMGAISRAKAGVLHKSLVINLPGSPKAVLENLEPILPAFRHSLDKLHGDATPCARLTPRPHTCPGQGWLQGCDAPAQLRT